MTQCPQCGAQTTEGQPFCGTCGATLAPAGQAPGTPDEPATQIRGQQPTAQFPSTPQQPQQQPGQAQQWGQTPGQQPPPPGGQPSGQHPQQQAPGQQYAGQPQQQWGQQGPPAGGQPSGPQQQWGQQPPPPPGQHGQPGQQQWGQQPPYQGQPGQQWGQPQHGGGPGGFDFSKLLVGNWSGMAAVAGAALGVAFLFGLLFAFTTANDLSVGSAIWTTLTLTAAAFGANTVVDMGDAQGLDDATYSLGQYPLLATLLALGVAGYLFRRSTASYRDIKDALLDAVRAALILALSVTIIAIVVTIAAPEVEGYLSPDAAGADDVVGLIVVDGETKVSIAGAIFLPLFLMLLVLGIVCFLRRDWLTGKAALVHDWIAAPMKGLGVIIAGLFALGVIYLVCQVIGIDDARGFAEIMRGLAILPSLGMFLVGLGVFGKLGSVTDTDGPDGDDSDDDWDRIGDFTSDNGAVFWIAPVAAIALAAAALWYIHMRTPDKTKLLRNFGIYLASLILVIPFLIRFANIHLGFGGEYDGDDFSVDSTAGTEGFQTMFFFLLISLVIAAILAVVTGSLDVNALKAKAQTFQGQPGQQGHPGQGQWGHQPQQGHPQQGQPQQWGQQPPPQQGGQPPQQQWGAPPPQQGQPPQQGGQWGQQPPPPQQGGQPPQQGGWGPPPQQ